MKEKHKKQYNLNQTAT